MVQFGEVAPWSRSSVAERDLEDLVGSGLLSPNVDPDAPAWMVPPRSHQEPDPPEGFVVSFVRLHERGFNVPAGRFLRGLCDHYDVELQNFAPNAISQAASFIAVCEGFLGIPPHWDLWVHLFRGELHTVSGGGRGVRRPVRAGGLTFAVRDRRRDMYLPCTMTSNNADWEKGWFYLRNVGDKLPAYTGKVLTERPEKWAHGAKAEDQPRLEPIIEALRTLARRGLTVASVIANFHRRRVVPLMERPLAIFEMSAAADAAALGRSRMLEEPLAPAYAAGRAKRAVDPRKVAAGEDALWVLPMRPDPGFLPLVSFSSLSRLG